MILFIRSFIFQNDIGVDLINFVKKCNAQSFFSSWLLTISRVNIYSAFFEHSATRPNITGVFVFCENRKRMRKIETKEDTYFEKLGPT